jgi:hypothetical protein
MAIVARAEYSTGRQRGAAVRAAGAPPLSVDILSAIPKMSTRSDQAHNLDNRQNGYTLYTIMEFEFDAVKSRKNLEKHGIDFVQVQALWDDPERIEVPARTEDEPRVLVIGRIGREHWSVVVAYRNERTRIISARRSRREEIHIYEG